MKSTTKRAISLLASGVFLILAFAVYGFFIRPVYDEVAGLRSELNSRDRFLREQNLALGKVSDLMIQYQGASQLRDTISLSLPLKEDLASIFNQLRVLAAVNGLTIDVFGAKPLAFQELARAPLIKRAGQLQLAVRALGSYDGFKNFLKNIETNVRVMDIQSISVERLGGPTANFFGYNLIINTYYQE